MIDNKTLQKLIDVAKKEFREDESTRRQALEQFRDWIEKNSDIRDCRTDDIFLLQFLRKRKFSVPMAQQMFLKHYTFCQQYSHFMKKNDIEDPKMNLYAKNGFVYTTPFRNEQGWRLSITRICQFDPYNSSYVDHVRALITNAFTQMEDEATQILGVVYVIDLADTTTAHMTHMPLPELLAVLKAVQQSVPQRYKGFHFINVAPLVRWIFDLIVSNVSGKMAKRFMFHSKMEDLYQHIDRKLLPKEYGGDMPEQEMIDLWYKELESKRELVLLIDNIRLVQLDNANLETIISTLPGSFRKLEVD